jgi:uncharacterized membrane protein YozB (DUF420 family)
MGLDAFVLISLVYAVLGVRVVWQLARSWRQTWDRRFTPDDRALVTQAAFFVLVPISVALHEVGHAVAIRALGGDVLGWGYYGFAGFVAYDPRQFDAVQQIVIAAAGTVVNLALGAAALGVVVLKRPPMRAAFNELLVQFTVISLLNALVLYPLLDFASGLNGDWRQMYFGGVPSLSLVILVVHVLVLAALYWGWKDARVRARLATLTGGGGMRPLRVRAGGGPPPARPGSPLERTLEEAGARAASGWPGPVQAGVQPTPDGAVLVLSWNHADGQRAVMARVSGERVDVAGAATFGGQTVRRPLDVLPTMPDADALTLRLRLAMEVVEGWDGAPATRA